MLLISSARVSFPEGLRTQGNGKLENSAGSCAEFEISFVFGISRPHFCASSKVENLLKTISVISGGGQARHDNFWR